MSGFFRASEAMRDLRLLIWSYSHEVFGAYVFCLPLRKLTPFALAGVGALIFHPTDSRALTRRPMAL
jgi:hypothetical protein